MFIVWIVALYGLLYVVGGYDGDFYLNSVEMYNPNTNTRSMLSVSMNMVAGVIVIEKPWHFSY